MFGDDLYMFSQYPKWSDLTIMQTLYSYPEPLDEERRKWSKGYIILVAKDNNTGKKVLDIIDNPKYEFFMLKDEYKNKINYNLEYIEKPKVTPVVTEYRNLVKTIAEKTNNINFYHNNISSGNRRDNNKLHLVPSVLFSDMNIEDRYRF